MPYIFQDLIHNLAIVLSLALLYSVAARRLRSLGERAFRCAVGLLFGSIAATGVWLHVPISTGVVLDPRAVITGIAGAFFGPSAALLAAAVAAAARIGVGGVGTLAGVGLAFGGAAAGILFYAHREGRGDRWGWQPLLLLGALQTLQTEAFGALLPPGHRETFFAETWLPLSVLFPGCTLLLGSLISHTHQRLAAEEELRASRLELRDVLDSSRDLIYRLDAQGRITFINRAVVRYGYQPAELVGRPVADFVHPDDREKVQKRLRLQLAGAATGDSFDFRCLDRFGGVVEFVSRAAAVPDDRGNRAEGEPAAPELQGMAHEVTEQRRTERENERLLDIFRETPNLIATAAPDGVIRYANPAFRRALGWPECDRDSTPRHLLDAFPAPVRTTIRDEALEEARRTGRWSGQTSVRLPDGREIPVFQLIMAHRDEREKLEQFSTVMVDITGRVQAEQSLQENRLKLAEALEATGAGILEGDLGSGTLRLDGRCAAILELVEEDVTFSMEAYEQLFVHPDHRPLHRAQWRELETGARQRADCAYRVQTRRTRRWRWVRVHAKVAERDEQGRPIRLLGTFTDITEHRILQEQLQQAQKMEAIGTLAGGIAHDFNNILTAMVGYTELALEEAPDNHVIRDALGNVLAAGRRAADLVSQILTFSRESRQEPRPVQTRVLAKEVTKLLRTTLPRTISVRSELSSAAVVLADPTRLHQVLMNLCTNAGLAMAEHGGVLAIRLEDVLLEPEFCSAHPPLEPGPHQLLTVADTGCGIAAEHLDRIFEPFFTTRAHDRGTGLGLSVVHGIVKQCGGTITVESRSGEGTAFQVYLPAAPTETMESETSLAAPLPAGTESILFVDDEELQAELAVQRLGRLGYRVRAFTDSVKALEAFRQTPDDYDLVITDLVMPHLPGDVLARRLMLVRPNLPIILCTGFSGDLSEAKAKAIGVRRLIKKPVLAADLCGAIREALG